MRVFRIYARKHEATAFSGDGARRFGGRWNSPGVSVVYGSSSLALALVELMANARKGRVPAGMVYRTVEIPDGMRIDAVGQRMLPANWFAYPAPIALRAIGDRWIRRGSSVALLVPSAIVRIEMNVLLNPNHGDFGRLGIGASNRLAIDERLNAQRTR